jgi:hypothetical protein
MEPNGFEIVPYYMESNNNNQKTGVKMKHTQGKWSVKQTDLKKAVVCGDMTIASNLYDENKNPPIEEIDANANLIALAPEMLEMLKNTESIVGLTSQSMKSKMSKLITRAEGK